MGTTNPTNGEEIEDSHGEDSDDTQYYPEEDSADALLIDEAAWRGLSEAHRMAANTASFSFVTSMEGIVQDLSDLRTTPATYTSLSVKFGDESPTVGRSNYGSEDEPQMNALARVHGKRRTTSSRHQPHAKKGAPFSYYGSLTKILSESALEESFLAKRPDRSRKEVSATEKRTFQKQFAEAKRLEYESWLEHDVFDLVDLRKVRPKNFVQGRWVLTITVPLTSVRPVFGF